MWFIDIRLGNMNNTIIPQFTLLRELSDPCRHPLHKGEKTKLKKLKKVRAEISEKIYQETGIVILIALRKYSKLLLFIGNRSVCY